MKVNHRIFLEVLFLLGALFLLMLVIETAQAGIIIVDDDGGADYQTIQDAINASTDGDTVKVYEGVYNEEVVVNKTLTLMGNGSKTVVDAGSRGDDTIVLQSNWCNISGFNLTTKPMASDYYRVAILSDFNTVSNCLFLEKNSEAIKIEGDHNTITNNTISSVLRAPAVLVQGNVNTIADNVLDDNGLALKIWGDGNEVLRNSCRECAGGMMVLGDDNNIASNTITGYGETAINMMSTQGTLVENNSCSGSLGGGSEKAAIFLSNSEHCEISHNTCEDYSNIGIFVHLGNENTVSHNRCEANTYVGDTASGIYVYESDNNTITNNDCNNNVGVGIFLFYANNSVISHNTCNDNGNAGITLVGSTGNEIFANTCNDHKEGGIFIAKDCGDNNIHDNSAKVVKEGGGDGGDSPGFGIAISILGILGAVFYQKKKEA